VSGLSFVIIFNVFFFYQLHSSFNLNLYLLSVPGIMEEKGRASVQGRESENDHEKELEDGPESVQGKEFENAPRNGIIGLDLGTGLLEIDQEIEISERFQEKGQGLETEC